MIMQKVLETYYVQTSDSKESIAEDFFGEGVEEFHVSEDTMFWTEDKEIIITEVVPYRVYRIEVLGVGK